MELKGKVALITGGGTGIGRATALKLANRGVNIVVNYSKSAREAEETVEELKELGVKALAYKADVAKDEEVKAMCRYVVKTLGRIDLVINSAGATDYVSLKDLDGMRDEYWDRAFNTNVKGIFHTVRACKEELIKNRAL